MQCAVGRGDESIEAGEFEEILHPREAHASNEVEGEEDRIDDLSHEAPSRIRAKPGVECLIGTDASPIEVLER
jgi:hypothetical protein